MCQQVLYGSEYHRLWHGLTLVLIRELRPVESRCHVLLFNNNTYNKSHGTKNIKITAYQNAQILVAPCARARACVYVWQHLTL